MLREGEGGGREAAFALTDERWSCPLELQRRRADSRAVACQCAGVESCTVEGAGCAQERDWTGPVRVGMFVGLVGFNFVFLS